jgi:hypothetical protein
MSKGNDDKRARKVRALKEAEREFKALEDLIATKGENAVAPLHLRGARRRVGARRSALARYDNSLKRRG